MPNRNDDRGFGADRWRRDDQRRPQDVRRGMGERDPRSFGEPGRYNSDQARWGPGSRGGAGEGEHEPWRRDRYGSRFDQDRTGYGSGWDRDGGGYGRGYGGQEYGMEGHGQDRAERGQPGPARPGSGERETWRDRGGAPYGDLELNPRASGVEEFGPPADYAYHPQAGAEFDPDYTRWRDEQLRSHDRDYREWRQQQHKQYDDDYRSFRSERREHFGKTFHEWCARRMSGASTPPTGGSEAQPEARSDFADTSPQVQAASEGWDTREPAEEVVRDKDAAAKDEPRH